MGIQKRKEPASMLKRVKDGEPIERQIKKSGKVPRYDWKLMNLTKSIRIT